MSDRTPNEALIKDYLQRVIAPRVQADTGWLDFERLAGDTLYLVARGECAACPAVPRCLDWVRERIEKDLSLRLTLVHRSEPYIWRKK